MKVADTEREKAQKKLQRAIVTTQGQAIGLGTIPALGLGTLASAAYYQQVCVTSCELFISSVPPICVAAAVTAGSSWQFLTNNYATILGNKTYLE